MTATDLFRTLGRVQYSLASVPLHALDRAAARYLPSGSPVRSTVEKGVETIDAAAERFLGLSAPESDTPFSPAAEATPVSRPRSPRPSPAAPARDSGNDDSTDQSTGSTSSDAAPVAADGPHPIEADETHRVAEETHRVADELREELDEAPLAGEMAEAPEDEKQRMADLRAKHLVEEFEAEQKSRHERFQQS